MSIQAAPRASGTGKGLHLILMGDVIGSSGLAAEEVSAGLATITEDVSKNSDGVSSPFTVTLGDEFQGIVASVSKAVSAIFALEESRLRHEALFRLRYVLYEGRIDTPLNVTRAHGMLGEGLTEARKELSRKDRDRLNFSITLKDKYLSEQLNDGFLVVDGLIDRWKFDDSGFIHAMLHGGDAEVGNLFGMDRSQVYKRRGTLLIREFQALRRVLERLAERKKQ